LSFLTWGFLVSSSLAFAETNPSLATVLTPEGVIREGITGSFDPTGFRMSYGTGGEPLFVSDEPSNWEPMLSFDMQSTEGYWIPLGTCTNSSVRAVAVTGSDVYAGGMFTMAGGNPANKIARWDGDSWSPLGSGVNESVNAIAVSGSNVYVGGWFTQAGDNPDIRFIARWDGSSWSALGSGVSNRVYAIAVTGSDVYIGGYFTQAGGISANRIARWDGSSWSALGSGVNSTVSTIALSGSDVYVGGVFTQAGGNPANRIARWDGTSWHALGSGLNDGCFAIDVSGSDVYVGGSFTQAGGISANGIARWNGSSWHAMGSGVGGVYPYVYTLAVTGSNVYAGGSFTLAGGITANCIALWDGTSWSALGSGLNNSARSIALSGSNLFVGGIFSQAGGNPAAYYIACWIAESTGIEPAISSSSSLLQASPNPMTIGTTLSFLSSGLSSLTLLIYDTAGRLVKTQDLGTLPVGSHSHYWDGRDGSGSALASGVYFVSLSSTEQQASTRVVLVR